MIIWRKQYVDPARDEVIGDSVAIDGQAEPSRTLQAYKDQCDIRVMLRQFGVTRRIKESVVEPMYGDFTDVGSYHDAHNRVIEAQASFMTLPAAVRERFRNDPGEAIAFLEDEGNRAEAEKLGLVPKKAPVEPVVLSSGGDSVAQ